MLRRDLYAILFVVFIGMFVVTFVATIYAVFFKGIEDEYRDRLFVIFISQIVVTGVGLFKGLTPPRPRTILHYEVQVTYQNYSDDLKKALNDEQKKLWNRYQRDQAGSQLTRKEQALISELKAAEINDGQYASGEMYLNCDSGSRYVEGSFLYRFPGDQASTHFPVTGELLAGGDLHVNIPQPERWFWDGDKRLIRPAVNYSLKLFRDAKDRKILTGTVSYPYQRSDEGGGPKVRRNDSKTEFAKVRLIEKD